LLWQQNSGHNGLELDLRKSYIEDHCVRWGVFEVGLFWYGQWRAQLFESAHMHPRKNHALNIRKIVIIYQQIHFYIFFNIAIIN